MRLLLRNDSTRNEILLMGVLDKDERVMRQALFAPMRGATAEVTAALIQRANDAQLPDELRARTIRALAATGRPEAMRWLVDHASFTKGGFPALGRTWLARIGLRKKSTTTLAAITGMGAHWRTAPEAAAVLELAAKSKDQDFRNAAMMHSEAL